MGGGGGGSGSVSGVILSPVVAASTTAFTVTYANGSGGIGATLTNAGAQAAISMDGVSPSAGQRVLIKDQASTLENGIYSVTTVGTGATNWVLTRTTDFDEPGEMGVGVVIEVSGGTVNDATLWEQSSAVTAVGTDAITFTAMNTVGLTASRALVTNAAGKLVVATTTAAEIGYVNGVTSGIQAQIDGLLAPYDLAFIAGFSSVMAAEDVAVRDYAVLVATRTGTFTGEVGKASVAPTGAALIIDVTKNGTSIYSALPQFAISATTLSAGTLKTDGTEDFVSGDVIVFKITQVGSTEPGEGVKFSLLATTAVI